ncbi:hypothetical protein [Nonomuraea sp. NPDC003804]|uniref:hypothetical protein n=1 Tax=Nonomuraea sp. NPDC003804 TaxID=3154547 RepID=UPI0033B6F8DA
MAVPPIDPPIERSQAVGLEGPAAGARFSWLLDVTLGLLIVAALPLAILAIPNTVSLVAALLPPEFDRLELIRAHGLALPAMMLTVPLASVLVQRMKAAPILLTGLAVLALADAAGGFAGSALLVGLLRVVHGIGAGLLVPALLMAAWERAPLLRALWTGMLAVSLLAAQALALWPLDAARHWRVTLQPYPLLTGIALGLAAVYLALGVVMGATGTPGPRAAERSRLTLTAVPAAGLAVLAVGTTFGWPAGLVILAALFSIAALLTLASIGTFEGPAGRALAYAMFAVGVVVLPTAAQVTYMELGGVGGPGLSGLWLPFVICAVLGAGAALAVGVLDRAAMPWLSRAGLVTIVVGLCAVRLMVPASDGFLLVVPFALLALGAAVALTAALRMSGPGAALYGLSLCFPGVLAGYLLGTGVQMVLLGRPQSAQQLVDRFVEALHLWALIGGFLVVAVIVLAALLGRRSAARAAAAAGDDEETPCGAPGDLVGTAAAADGLSGSSPDLRGPWAARTARERAAEFPVAGDGIAPEEPAGTSATWASRQTPIERETGREASGGPRPGQETSDGFETAREAPAGLEAAREAPIGLEAAREASAERGGRAWLSAERGERVPDEDTPTGEVPRVTAAQDRRMASRAGAVADESTAARRADGSPGSSASPGQPAPGTPGGAPTLSTGDGGAAGRSPGAGGAAGRSTAEGEAAGRAAGDGGAGGRAAGDGGARGRAMGDGGAPGSGVTDGLSAGGARDPRPSGEVPAGRGVSAEGPGEGTGPMPVVPPPAQSPEDAADD